MTFEAKLQRLRNATKASTQVELAEILEISQPAVSKAIKRKNIPATWLIKLHTMYYDIGYINTGNRTQGTK